MFEIMQGFYNQSLDLFSAGVSGIGVLHRVLFFLQALLFIYVVGMFGDPGICLNYPVSLVGE